MYFTLSGRISTKLGSFGDLTRVTFDRWRVETWRGLSKITCFNRKAKSSSIPHCTTVHACDHGETTSRSSQTVAKDHQRCLTDNVHRDSGMLFALCSVILNSFLYISVAVGCLLRSLYTVYFKGNQLIVTEYSTKSTGKKLIGRYMMTPFLWNVGLKWNFQ